jgi:hypothetical protein
MYICITCYFEYVMVYVQSIQNKIGMANHKHWVRSMLISAIILVVTNCNACAKPNFHTCWILCHLSVFIQCYQIKYIKFRQPVQLFFLIGKVRYVSHKDVRKLIMGVVKVNALKSDLTESAIVCWLVCSVVSGCRKI